MGILIIFPVYPHNPQTQISQAPRGAIPDASSTSRQGLEGQGILWWWRYVTISWLSPANDVSKLNIGWLHQQKWWFHMVSYCFLPKKKVNTSKKKWLIWWLERCNKWWSVKWPFLVFVAWLGARNCWVIWCKNINHQPFCWIYIYIYIYIYI